MLLSQDNIILGNTGDGSPYKAFKPWHHASGVERWRIDDVKGTQKLDEYLVRLATDAEIQDDPRYAAWLAGSQLTITQTQAKVNFSTIPKWIGTGTADQGEAGSDANVTTLAGAKVALKNLARIIIFLRDFVKFSN